MKIGMLWYDNSKIKLAEKVRQARDYYRTKYGKAANACYVNQREIDVDWVDGIEVKASNQVNPGYLWIGTEER